MDAGATRTIPRTDLAVLLQHNRYHLAGSARDSLASPEAPDLLRIHVASRSELVATYESRLARAENGDGPATHGLHEYTERLRHESTPDELGEIGWAVGDMYYVVLVHDHEVLAVTTVARAVWLLEHGLGVTTFGIGTGFNDLTLIKNTLDQPAYAELRGTVRAFDLEAFTHVTAQAARAAFDTWPDGTDVGKIHQLLEAADDVYSTHDARELIAIDRTAHRLHVVVSGDD